MTALNYADSLSLVSHMRQYLIKKSDATKEKGQAENSIATERKNLSFNEQKPGKIILKVARNGASEVTKRVGIPLGGLIALIVFLKNASIFNAFFGVIIGCLVATIIYGGSFVLTILAKGLNIYDQVNKQNKKGMAAKQGAEGRLKNAQARYDQASALLEQLKQYYEQHLQAHFHYFQDLNAIEFMLVSLQNGSADDLKEAKQRWLDEERFRQNMKAIGDVKDGQNAVALQTSQLASGIEHISSHQGRIAAQLDRNTRATFMAMGAAEYAAYWK